MSIQPQVFPAYDFDVRRGLGHLSDRNATIGLSWAWGSISDLALVDDHNAIKLPHTVDDRQGAL